MAEDEVSYRIGRGEVKYEIFQILEKKHIESMDSEDAKIMLLKQSILSEIREEIEKL